jgi:hypothetical protein
MRLQLCVLIAALAPIGCAGGTVDGGADGDAEVVGELSTSTLYEYVSPTDPTATNPLALYRANAVPGALSPTYGAATLPDVSLAPDAHTTQAALDAIFDLPYAGNGTNAVAVFIARDASSVSGGPAVQVTDIYTPSQTVPLGTVVQKQSLYQILPASGGKVTVRMLNEKDYPAGTPAFDYGATVDPAAAQAAVQAGAIFSGTVDIKCTKILFWTSCKPPTGVHVSAYYTAK